MSWFGQVTALAFNFVRLIPGIRSWIENLSGKYEQLGMDYYANDRLIESAGKLSLAAQLLPENAELLSNLGQVYFELGDPEKAEAYFRKALKLDYDNLHALKGLAYTLHGKDDLREAMYVYLRYIQVDNKDADVFLNLGATLHDLDNHQKAIEYYQKAEELEPENSELQENIARAYYSLGKIHEARERTERALKIDPANNEARGLHALLLEVTGDFKGAAAEFESVLKVNPEDGQARLGLARVLAQLKKSEQALENANYALRILKGQKDDNGLKDAYWMLGWCYFLVEDWDNSILASRQTLSMDAGLFPVRFNLALALLHKGDDAAARMEYDKGMLSVAGAGDLQYYAIDDLAEAVRKRPELPGAPDLLIYLQKRCESLPKTVNANEVTKDT